MGVMKIGNIVHRAGVKPTYFAFQASVHIGFGDITTITMPACLFCPLHQRSVQTTTPCPLEL